ncbi:hypothetical protein PRUPE_1G391700 [Prunus persica]|uniref:Uncharacterized protein n=1 Tax=Prunus persica TaxID=3760 RepID=A0A251RA71_PRUPE|nr:hypothetical protein PRUPE_1G391700 [Prunus persica]
MTIDLNFYFFSIKVVYLQIYLSFFSFKIFIWAYISKLLAYNFKLEFSSFSIENPIGLLSKSFGIAQKLNTFFPFHTEKYIN